MIGKNNFKRILQDSIKSGFIGIGIAITFSIIFDGLYNSYDLLIWTVMVFFGFVVGFMISLSNRFMFHILTGLMPGYFRNFFIQLIMGFFLSTLVFYGTGYLILVKWFNFMPANFLIFVSMGTGVASMMIHMFFSYSQEQEEKIFLEKENRKLAVVEERNRIARELHDSVSQNLFGINLNLNTLAYILDQDRDRAVEMIRELQEMVQEVQTEMRLMIYELRPLALQEKGFFEAVENLIALFRARYSLDINCQMVGDEDRLNSKSQLVLYRVLQESLNNIVKHAEADKIKVGLKINDENVEMTVRDNGKGFAPDESIEGNNNFGIKGMKERVKDIGGVVEIKSLPGKGTVVFTKIDCDNLHEGV